MSKKLPSLIEGIGDTVVSKVLVASILVGTLLLASPLFDLAEKTGYKIFNAVGALIFLAGLLTAIFPAKEVYFRMVEDRTMSFSIAVAHTWYRYLLYVAFLPLIGRYVQRFVEGRKKENPFIADENANGLIVEK